MDGFFKLSVLSDLRITNDTPTPSRFPAKQWEVWYIGMENWFGLEVFVLGKRGRGGRFVWSFLDCLFLVIYDSTPLFW